MKSGRNKKPRPPLDAEALERLALFYAGRYATTRAKLATYLRRKLQERGWEGPGEPPVERLIERFAELGYVDDRAFASARAASLQRRGYGERRIGEALRAAGIEAGEADRTKEEVRPGAWEAALRYAKRKRIGPYAAGEADREARQKAFAAMMRAGHPADIVRSLLDSRAGEVPNPDEL